MYQKLGRALFSLLKVALVVVLQLPGLAPVPVARPALAAGGLQIDLFAVDASGWMLTATNNSGVSARLQGEILLDGALADTVDTEAKMPGGTWSQPGTWAQLLSPGSHTAAYHLELRQEGCGNLVGEADATIAFDVVYNVTVSAACGEISVAGHADTGAELRMTGTDANGEDIDITEQVTGDFSFSYDRTDPGTYGPHTVSLAAGLRVGGEQLASDSFHDDLICGAPQYSVDVSGSCDGFSVAGHADTAAELRVTGTDANGETVDVAEQVVGEFSFDYGRTDPRTYGPHAVNLTAELLVLGRQVSGDSFDDDLICGVAEYSVEVSGSCDGVSAAGRSDTAAELRVTGTDANGAAVDITEQVMGDFSFDYGRRDPGTYGPHSIDLAAELVVDGSPVASDSFQDDLICGEPQASACYAVEVPRASLPKEGDELAVCAGGDGSAARLMNLTDDVQVGAQEPVGSGGEACFTRRLYPEVRYQIQYQGEAGGWSSTGCAFTLGKEVHIRGDVFLRKSVVAPCDAIAGMIDHYGGSGDWKLSQVAQTYHVLDLHTVDGELFDPSCEAYGGPSAEVEVWGAAFKSHLSSPDGHAVHLTEYFSADGYDGLAGASLWDDNLGQEFGVVAAEFPPLAVGEYQIQSPFDWMAETFGFTWQGEILEGKPMADHLGLMCPSVQRGEAVYCGWIRNTAQPISAASVLADQPPVSYGHAAGDRAAVVNSLTIEGHETRDVVQLVQWDDLPATSRFGLSPDGSVIGGHLDDETGNPDVGKWIAAMEIGDRAGLGDESYVAVRRFSTRQTGNLRSDLKSISHELEDGQRALVTCDGVWEGQLYGHLTVVVLSPG